MEKNFNEERCENAVKELLLSFGCDLKDPNLIETPHRVMKYWREMLQGEYYTNQEIAEMYGKNFNVGYDPLVTMQIKDLYSTCCHHTALMFDGDCIVGYVPVQNPDGTYKVLGLSKLPRIVDMCCKRLQLQEKIASDIAECISLATGSDKVYVNLNMKHGCVSARGIKADSQTNVAFMTKELRKDVELRNEFERKAAELLSRN